MLTAVITVLLQKLDLAGFGQGGGKAADVGLDLRGDGVAEQRERKPHRRFGAHVEAERDGAPGTIRLEFVGAVEGERPARVGQGEPRRFGRVGDRESGRLLARELGITRTDREALGPLREGFSRCCPQPGYRSGYDQG